VKKAKRKFEKKQKKLDTKIKLDEILRKQNEARDALERSKL